MFSCSECDKVFSTKHSLSSHRYKYHKSKADPKHDPIIDDDTNELSESSAVDQLGSESEADEKSSKESTR